MAKLQKKERIANLLTVLHGGEENHKGAKNHAIPAQLKESFNLFDSIIFVENEHFQLLNINYLRACWLEHIGSNLCAISPRSLPCTNQPHNNMILLQEEALAIVPV